MGLVFVIMAVGIVLAASVNRILFMAHGTFYTMGAYFTWWVMHTLHLHYFIGLLVAVLGTGLIGVIVYLLIFRRLQLMKGAFLATLVASMGLNQVLTQGNLITFGTPQRSIPTVFTGSVEILGVTMVVAKLVLIGLSTLVCVALFIVYAKTRIGRAMRTASSLPQVAPLQGVNLSRVCLVTLALSCALAGVAGGLLAPSYGMNQGMGADVLWTVMLMAMLGGMSSLMGALVGGLVIGQMLSFGQYFLGGIVQLIVFIIIFIVLYFRPNGLIGRGVDIRV